MQQSICSREQQQEQAASHQQLGQLGDDRNGIGIRQTVWKLVACVLVGTALVHLITELLRDQQLSDLSVVEVSVSRKEDNEALLQTNSSLMTEGLPTLGTHLSVDIYSDGEAAHSMSQGAMIWRLDGEQGGGGDNNGAVADPRVWPANNGEDLSEQHASGRPGMVQPRQPRNIPFAVAELPDAARDPQGGRYSPARWREFQRRVTFHLPRIPGMREPSNEECCTFNGGLHPVPSLGGPGLLVVGVQKGGTTAVHNELVSARPQAFVGLTECRAYPEKGAFKEVHFWDQLQTSQDMLEQYLKGYKRQQELVGVDSSPTTMRMSYSACRVKQALPHVKAVLLLREPASRMRSAYLMNCRVRKRRDPKYVPQPFTELVAQQFGALGDLPEGCQFGIHLGNTLGGHDAGDDVTGDDVAGDDVAVDDDAAAAEGVRKSWGQCAGCEHVFSQRGCFWQTPLSEADTDGSVSQQYWSHLAKSMYAPQLAWWLDFFPPDQLMVINSARSQEQPEEVLDDIYRFVGLDPPPRGTAARRRALRDVTAEGDFGDTRPAPELIGSTPGDHGQGGAVHGLGRGASLAREGTSQGTFPEGHLWSWQLGEAGSQLGWRSTRGDKSSGGEARGRRRLRRLLQEEDDEFWRDVEEGYRMALEAFRPMTRQLYAVLEYYGYQFEPFLDDDGNPV